MEDGCCFLKGIDEVDEEEEVGEASGKKVDDPKVCGC
jgi:hypothetical protein